MTTTTPTESLTLARGAPLTPDTWADFVTRLRHDCVGEGVREHCTADALFIVQAKRIISGFDRDYCDSSSTMVYCDDRSWFSPKEYWADAGRDQRAQLHTMANEWNRTSGGFLALQEFEQWEVLDDLPGHTVTGWHEEWAYVNSHLTQTAADAFIARKKHDYPEGLRVCVESQCYAWEFNIVKEAILSGILTLAT